MKLPKVAIITTTFNQQKLLGKCLASLKKTNYNNYKVYFLDDSGMGKIGKYIKKRFRLVDVTTNKENFGYSISNNILIKKALKQYNPDYILHIDDDTEIIERDWLIKMINIAESDDEIGIVGCKIVHPDGSLQWFFKNNKINFLKNRNKEKETRETYGVKDIRDVIGACFLIKKEVIQKIGLFDEKFSPVYGEETDYCLRASKKGFRLVYVGNTKLIHHGGSSTKDMFNEKIWFIKKRNAIRLECLNYNVFKILKYNLIHFGSAILSKHPLKKLKLLLRAYEENLKNLKEIKRKRAKRKINRKYFFGVPKKEDDLKSIYFETTLVSIIMPVYNAEEYLDSSISSILKQTFKNFEFIIIDDASTDNSLKIIKKYSKIDKRIKIIRNKKNLGLNASINKGFEIARGRYIARMDADDFSLKKRLLRQYSYLERHPKIFLVGSSAYVMDKEGAIIGKFWKYQNSFILGWRLRRTNSLIHPSIMFRNDGRKYIESRVPEIMNEHNFYKQILKERKKIINLSDYLLLYRINPKGMCATLSDTSKSKFAEYYSLNEDINNK